jgi:hypothetical protein
LKRIISLKTLSKYLSYGSAVTVAGLLALSLVWMGPISSVEAVTGSTPAAAKQVSANGTATATITGTGATSGNLVQFSSSKGTFENGSSTYITTANSSGVATAKLKSTTQGNALVNITNLSTTALTSVLENSVTFVGTPTWAGKSAKSSLELNTTIAADDNFFVTIADAANAARTIAAGTPTATDALGQAVFVTIGLANDGNADTPGKILLTGTDINGSTQQESVTVVANSTAISDKAFKSITAAVMSGWTADGNADNLIIGYAANRAGANGTPTALTYSSSSELDVDGLSDSKGTLISGAVVTMTIDGDGTWDTTGTQEVVLVTDANGDITAQGLTVGSGGKSATVTVATSGSFGVSSVTSKFKQNGVYATAELAGPTSTTSIITLLGDEEAGVVVARLLTKDSGGNKVDSTSTPTISCVGTDSKGAALITSSTITDATASDGYREITIDPAAKNSATPAVCTWKIAASGTEPATTGTLDITVADEAIKSVTVVVGDGSDVTPGVPVTVTATLLDKNGTPIRTGNPADTVTIAVNGTSGGNQLINASARTHKNGVVTATFIPGDKLGNFTVTATPSISTTKVGYVVVKIVSATAAEPAITITGDVSATGSSLVVVNGSATGSKIVELTDAKSVWVTENGVYKGYVAGAPAFVNADFPVSNTGAVIVVK